MKEIPYSMPFYVIQLPTEVVSSKVKIKIRESEKMYLKLYIAFTQELLAFFLFLPLLSIYNQL